MRDSQCPEATFRPSSQGPCDQGLQKELQVSCDPDNPPLMPQWLARHLTPPPPAKPAQISKPLPLSCLCPATHTGDSPEDPVAGREGTLWPSEKI